MEVLEFRAYFVSGDFGVRLREHLATLAARPSQCPLLPDFLSTVVFTSPDQLNVDENDYMARWRLTGLWGPIEMYAAAQRALWQREFGWFTIKSLVKRWLNPNEPMVRALVTFRFLWDNIFKDVSTWLRKIDRPETPGRAAEKLGLGYLYQPDAPPFSRAVIPPPNHTDPAPTPSEAPTPAVASPSEGYVETIPIATPGESVARSGHAYLSEIGEQSGTKEKVKTRKAPAARDSKTDQEGEEPEEDDEDRAWTDLPEILPVEFKLGKKTMKVCVSSIIYL